MLKLWRRFIVRPKGVIIYGRYIRIVSVGVTLSHSSDVVVLRVVTF